MPDLLDYSLGQLTWQDDDIPLIPSVEDVISFAQMLDAEGKYLDLDFAVSQIKNNLLGFVKVGLTAWRIQFSHLYKKTHSRFQDFCSETIGLSYWQVKRFMEAARVVLELARSGFDRLPTCEAQARPLVNLKGYDLCEKWREVIESMPAHQQTANSIDAIVNPDKVDAQQNIRLPKAIAEKLRRAALDRGLKVEELLDELLDEGTEEAEVEAEKLANWQTDLEELKHEHSNGEAQRTTARRDSDSLYQPQSGHLDSHHSKPSNFPISQWLALLIHSLHRDYAVY